MVARHLPDPNEPMCTDNNSPCHRLKQFYGCDDVWDQSPGSLHDVEAIGTRLTFRVL